MGRYFEDHQSMFAQAGMQVEKTLDAVMRRYRGQNPPNARGSEPTPVRGSYAERTTATKRISTRGFRRPGWGLCYAWARIWSDARSELRFDLSVHCPTVLYLNQQCFFRSTILEERYPDARQRLRLPLEEGWNHLVLRFKKTGAGFGGVFGTWLGKASYYFLMPTEGRAGQEGWIFSQPQTAELPLIPAGAWPRPTPASRGSRIRDGPGRSRRWGSAGGSSGW